MYSLGLRSKFSDLTVLTDFLIKKNGLADQQVLNSEKLPQFKMTQTPTRRLSQKLTQTPSCRLSQKLNQTPTRRLSQKVNQTHTRRLSQKLNQTTSRRLSQKLTPPPVRRRMIPLPSIHLLANLSQV